MLEVVKLPHHPLVASYFEQLGLIRSGVGVANNDVAAWQ
jgi:hypothetical protein